MSSDQIIKEPAPPKDHNFDIVILSDDSAVQSQLQKLTTAEFPDCLVKTMNSSDRFRPPTNTNLPLLFIADYNAIAKDNSALLKKLRLTTPNIWICVATRESDLVTAFDRLGASVDDFIPIDDQFSNAIRNSVNRVFNLSSQESPDRATFNARNIPLNVLIDSTHDSFVVLDGEGLLLFANSRWEENFTNPALERTYLYDITHPNDLHRLEADLQLAILEKGQGSAVFRIRSKLDRWETLQATIIGFEAEGIHVALISARNVSELHRMQSRLQELEMQNQLYQENSDALVYRFNLQNQTLQYVTEFPLAKYGYCLADFQNSTSTFFEIIIEKEYLTEFQLEIDGLIRRGSSSAAEIAFNQKIICKDGSLKAVIHKVRLDWSRDGVHFWINGTIREIVPRSEQTATPNLTEAIDRKLLFEAMLEGIAEFSNISGAGIKSSGLKCVSCNKAFENFIGLPRDRIIGSFLFDLFPGLDETPLNIDSEESLPDVLENVAGGGSPRTIEDYFWPHLRAYFNISATSVQIGSVSLMMTDVTRRKHAEIRLATLLRGLPDTALYQTGGGVEYISDGIAEMLGYAPEVFQNDRNFFDSLIHPDDRDNLAKAQNRWISKGSRRVLEMEFRVRHRDGHYIWILDRMSKAFTTPDGKQSSQGVMIDISSRKQLEAERQIELAEMEAVFKSLPELLFRLDENGTILSYRVGREDLLLLKPDEVLNRSMFELLPDDLGQKFKKLLKSTFKSRQESRIEYSLDLPAGKKHFEARFYYISEALITVVIREEPNKS